MRGWDCAQGSGLWRKLPEVEVIGERDHVQLCDVVVAVVGRQPATAWLSAVGWLCAADGREGAAGEPHLHPPRVHSCRLGGVVSTMIRTTRGAISGLSQCSVARVLNRAPGASGRRIGGVESRRAAWRALFATRSCPQAVWLVKSSLPGPSRCSNSLFSASWLRSSVVSVLISLISGMLDTVQQFDQIDFSPGLCALACQRNSARGPRLARSRDRGPVVNFDESTF